MREYEIDQLSEKKYKDVCGNFSYIVVVDLPYCTAPGPFRILAQTKKQVLTWRHRRRVTKITMWPFNMLSGRKRKIVSVIPNPIKYEEFPGLLLCWGVAALNGYVIS